MNKYLTRDEILSIIGIVEASPNFALMSQDSYNEELIAKRINETGKTIELFHATLNLSIVGYGNQRYGNYLLNGQVMDIANLLTGAGVKLRLPLGTVLKEDDLTPHRLCRFFRYEIRDHLRKFKISSYLYRKFSTHDPAFFDICFRGSEYLDGLNINQQSYLLGLYQNLDNRFGTRIEDRILRVFQAKTGNNLKI